jgi:hypothetical protein
MEISSAATTTLGGYASGPEMTLRLSCSLAVYRLSASMISSSSRSRDCNSTHSSWTKHKLCQNNSGAVQPQYEGSADLCLGNERVLYLGDLFLGEGSEPLIAAPPRRRVRVQRVLELGVLVLPVGLASSNIQTVR